MVIVMSVLFVKKMKIPSWWTITRIYAVADGVGGLPFGALASKLAVQFFKSSIQDAEDCTTVDELRLLAHSIHQNIVECGTIVGGENGIGCTFSGLRLMGDKLSFVHVGDSSIFLCDQNGIRKFPNVIR